MLLLGLYVMNASRFCHITPIMCDLQWLPIRARINFKVLLVTFEALHGLAPQYLQPLISIKTSSYNLRGSNTLQRPQWESAHWLLQRGHCGTLCLASFAQSHVLIVLKPILAPIFLVMHLFKQTFL